MKINYNKKAHSVRGCHKPRFLSLFSCFFYLIFLFCPFFLFLQFLLFLFIFDLILLSATVTLTLTRHIHVSYGGIPEFLTLFPSHFSKNSSPSFLLISFSFPSHFSSVTEVKSVSIDPIDRFLTVSLLFSSSSHTP